MTGQKISCCTKKFHYKGYEGNKHPASGWNAWTSENIVADPEYVAKFNRSAVRPKFVAFPDRKPTICDKKLRTVNTNAECGAPDDFWYHLCEILAEIYDYVSPSEPGGGAGTTIPGGTPASVR